MSSDTPSHDATTQSTKATKACCWEEQQGTVSEPHHLADPARLQQSSIRQAIGKQDNAKASPFITFSVQSQLHKEWRSTGYQNPVIAGYQLRNKKPLQMDGDDGIGTTKGNVGSLSLITHRLEAGRQALATHHFGLTSNLLPGLPRAIREPPPHDLPPITRRRSGTGFITPWPPTTDVVASRRISSDVDGCCSSGEMNVVTVQDG